MCVIAAKAVCHPSGFIDTEHGTCGTVGSKTGEDPSITKDHTGSCKMETPVNMMCLPSWAQDCMALQTRHNDAIEWLQTNVKSTFWCKLKTWFEEITQTHRTYIAGYNKKYGLTKKKSAWKLCSYFGAIRVPKAFSLPKQDIAWEDDTDTYIDPGNWVYAQVFQECWPEAAKAWGLSDKGTIGDMVEALLGWHWHKTTNNGKVPTLEKDVVKNLEASCLTLWLLHNPH